MAGKHDAAGSPLRKGPERGTGSAGLSGRFGLCGHLGVLLGGLNHVQWLSTSKHIASALVERKITLPSNRY